ncbi:MAG: MerR family transcriptional regulator [Deferrisomatales bacterium]|nr:MerR family transcriptional regulator [Deferrisomatales bacterium]
MTERTAHLLQIGEVARQAGVTVRTIRYYLEEGFLEAAERSPGGFYLFEDQAVETARYVQSLNDLGFPLKEIKALLQIRRDKATGDEAHGPVLQRLAEQRKRLVQRIQESSRLLGELDEAIDLVGQCRGCRKKPNRKNCRSCEAIAKWKDLPLPYAAIL